MHNYDIIIVGAGASGMMAAISAARFDRRLSIAVLERNQRAGKKLLTTGNGRCNISNLHIDPVRFHGNSSKAIKEVLSAKDKYFVKDIFASFGIPFIAEDDKLFPYSLQASSVIDALRYECERLNIDVICEQFVIEIRPDLTVVTESDVYSASSVVVSCGGSAAPKTGSDGNGVKLLKKLGHSAAPIFPSIVPIRTELQPIKPLKGVRVNGTIRLYSVSRSISESGEVLFTEYGISGPAVMQISRFVNEMNGKNIMASVDFLPEYSQEALTDYLLSRKNLAYNDSAENLTLGLLNKRVGQAVLKYSGYNINDRCSGFSRRDIEKISASVKNFEVKVTGTCSFDSAQTTAGGICIDEFDSGLGSKLVSGLYACGEVLDCDGDCGGFNLHWAWVSGAVAGENAARRSVKCLQ